jgi:hypothetical protein
MVNKLDIVKALLADETKDEIVNDGGIKICILQRGWVFIGRFSQVGSKCTLKDAYNIRTWGTTKGLGQLASDGPVKDKTNLDKVNDVTFHELTAVAMIDCDYKTWNKEL